MPFNVYYDTIVTILLYIMVYKEKIYLLDILAVTTMYNDGFGEHHDNVMLLWAQISSETSSALDCGVFKIEAIRYKTFWSKMNSRLLITWIWFT